MQDHDQRFKTLIREFFVEFLMLFFASWAQRFDCSQVEWLDKEVFSDPPQGDRKVLDLVGKVPTREEVPGQYAGEKPSWLALVHIEIESPDKAAPLRPRIYRTSQALRDRHQLPVLPIGLFLKVGLEGIGIDVYEEYFWELRTVRFEYLYAGLPALDAVKYLEGDNVLGWALAALMKIPKDQVAWLGAEALRRITEAPLSDQKRFLLGECVQAYLPLDEEQKRVFDALLATEKYVGVRAVNKTVYEQGREKEGLEMIRELLEDRFGPLSAAVVDRLQQLSLAELRQLGKRFYRVQSLNELGFDQEESP